MRARLRESLTSHSHCASVVPFSSQMDISSLSRFETLCGILLGVSAWRLVVEPVQDNPDIVLPPLLYATFILVALFLYHILFASQFAGIILCEDIAIGDAPAGQKRVFVKANVSTLLFAKRDFWLGVLIGSLSLRFLITPLIVRPTEVWEVSAFYLGVILLLSLNKAFKKTPIVFPTIRLPDPPKSRRSSQRRSSTSTSVSTTPPPPAPVPASPITSLVPSSS